MKACFVFSTALLSVAAAFPANLLKGDISEDALAEITALAAKIAGDVKEKRDFTGVFNADRQRVDTTGKHAYVRTLRSVLKHIVTDCLFLLDGTWSQ